VSSSYRSDRLLDLYVRELALAVNEVAQLVASRRIATNGPNEFVREREFSGSS